MERPTAADLQNTVESQKEQIQKYETRLRDVVRAYKGLVKEKEALEASLKVLSVAPRTCGDPRDFSEPLQSGQIAADQGSSVRGESQDEARQIHTLSSSLATLTEEKSRLEASFLEDKKKMRDTVYWRCRHHPRGCRATATTQTAALVKSDQKHNHQIDRRSFEVAKIVNKMKKRSREEVTPVSAIYEEELAGYRNSDWSNETEQLVARMPNFDSCSSSRCRSLAKLHSPLPKTKTTST
ncbi:uncharacterized protein LOC124276723 [Haliotis rubra]|uniref:uncharacterized protein LOC124276723 n=1 Tax=Haliotis rubra TaxID=36100 RepID=UPI001EE5C0F0|nr:uncharacterized protein LOC124276723 [Haliotis rubra]